MIFPINHQQRPFSSISTSIEVAGYSLASLIQNIKPSIMKKVFVYTFICVSSLVLITSCSKTDLSNPSEEQQLAQSGNSPEAKGPPASAVVRVKTRTFNGDLRTYTYDASNRSLGSTSVSYNSVTYQYPDASHIHSIIKYPGGSIAGETDYELNSKGLISKATASTLQGFYTYNGKKQLIKHIVNFTNGDIATGDFTYTSGNLTSIQSLTNGSPSWNKTFTYYTNIDNVLSNEVFGESFTGAESKNLVKSMSFVINGGSTTTENYTYEFDAQGRVTKQKVVKNGVLQPDILYTYY